ncbi:MAG: DUF721 domain-containing protein [Deltaproteobacteria bacterium]|nr:DUF721 domain-containing protein [Deltaproteobacteria bacterium]
MRQKLRNPLSLADLLSTAMKPGLSDPKTILLDLQSQWAEIVTPFLERKSKPIKIYGQCLVIEVASSAWAQEMEMMKTEILKKIKSLLVYANITGLRFKVN